MTTKVCICCHRELAAEEFHRHAQMKDGRLNKCRNCVAKHVAEWRKKNPDARKREHANNRERKGFKTRAEYDAERAKNKAGRRAVSLKHTHKRIAQKLMHPKWCQEFDDFVVEEAIKLTKLRESMFGGKWQVDHIVPLNHREACGLHNAYNLQVVPAFWNRSKGNRSMDLWRP